MGIKDSLSCQMASFLPNIELSIVSFSLVYLVEFHYIVELCPHNTRFMWNTGSGGSGLPHG
jgi:hypothetical protein